MLVAASVKDGRLVYDRLFILFLKYLYLQRHQFTCRWLTLVVPTCSLNANATSNRPHWSQRRRYEYKYENFVWDNGEFETFMLTTSKGALWWCGASAEVEEAENTKLNYKSKAPVPLSRCVSYLQLQCNACNYGIKKDNLHIAGTVTILTRL